MCAAPIVADHEYGIVSSRYFYLVKNDLENFSIE
jgi:hypothetical protein